MFLEALKPHGRAGNLKNQLKGFLPDILAPFLPSSFVTSADILCFVCFLAIFHSKRPLAKFLNYVRWSTIHFPTFDMHFVNSFFSFNGYFVVFVKLSKPKTLKTGKKWGKIFQSVLNNTRKGTVQRIAILPKLVLCTKQPKFTMLFQT